MGLEKDLVVYTKTEQLFYKIYPRLFNFPKIERQGLCIEIKEAFFGMLKNMDLGISVKSKRKTYLQEADGYLRYARTTLKLARYRKYISQGFFEVIDMDLTEINKMLSGFIKSASR